MVEVVNGVHIVVVFDSNAWLFYKMFSLFRIVLTSSFSNLLLPYYMCSVVDVVPSTNKRDLFK